MGKLTNLIAIYGDDVALAGYNLRKAKSNSEESKKRRKLGKIPTERRNFHAMQELTKKASAEATAAAQKAYDMMKAVRKWVRIGYVATPIAHEDDMDALKKKFQNFNKAVKKNPDLLKELKK